MTGRFFLRAVKALVRVTLSDSFRIRPRTKGLESINSAKFSPLNHGWHQAWLVIASSYGITGPPPPSVPGSGGFLSSALIASATALAKIGILTEL